MTTTNGEADFREGSTEVVRDKAWFEREIASLGTVAIAAFIVESSEGA